MLHKYKLILNLSFAVFLMSGIVSCASKPSIPSWTYDLNSIYDNSKYIARSALSGTRENAKAEALSQIAGYFESRVSSDSTAFQYSESNSSFREAYSKTVNVKSDVELLGIQYEFYYDSKKDTHYAVAYINRQETWNHLYTKMEAEKKTFYELLKKASSIEKKEPLQAVRDYTKAYEHLLALEQYIDFAGLVLPENTNLYDKDIQKGGEIAVILKTLKRNCSFDLNVSGDSEDIIRGTIRDIFSREGFSVTDGGTSSPYRINVIVDLNPRVDGPSVGDVVYSAVPNIDVEIYEGSRLLLSYAKNLPKVKFFSLEACRKRGMNDLCSVVKETLLGEFYENL